VSRPRDVPLRAYVDRRFKELDKRIRAAFDAQQEAVREVKAQSDADNLRQNHVKESLAEMRAGYATHDALRRVEEKVDAVAKWQTAQEGHKGGVTATVATIYALAGFVVACIIIGGFIAVPRL
jgi:hypothetical protein